MMYRLSEFSIQGGELAFMQHAHIARRVLEIGKWLALGEAVPLHLREGASGARRHRPLCARERRRRSLSDL